MNDDLAQSLDQLEGATAAMTKYIFVTGGVASSVGKGITVASIGRLFKSRGLRVSVQKLDPYINVDPGTMSPYQHGEVFVTEDGAETDLDLGHYERFIDGSRRSGAAIIWAARSRSFRISPTRSKAALPQSRANPMPMS